MVVDIDWLGPETWLLNLPARAGTGIGGLIVPSHRCGWQPGVEQRPVFVCHDSICMTMMILEGAAQQKVMVTRGHVGLSGAWAYMPRFIELLAGT